MTLQVVADVQQVTSFSGESEVADFEQWQREMRKLDKLTRLLAGAQLIRKLNGVPPWPEQS